MSYPLNLFSGHCSSSEGLHSAIPVLSSWDSRHEPSIQSHTTPRYTGSRVDVSVIFVAPPSSRLLVFRLTMASLFFDTLALNAFSSLFIFFVFLSFTRTFDRDCFFLPIFKTGLK